MNRSHPETADPATDAHELPSRDVAVLVAAHSYNREQAAAYVAKLIGRDWSVGALDSTRRRGASGRRPAFPEPIKTDPPTWWGPDLDEWVLYSYPKPRPRDGTA